MKKRKKLICSIITILIFSCFFKAFIDTPKSYTLTEEVYTHRRQSWLKAINWDDNRLEYSGKGIKIAVIDSGVESNVPELKGKIRSELSIIDNTERQKKEAKHGTAVASIISAESHSSEQVMGIACNAELIVIDVTDQKDGIVKVNDLVEGIREAIRQDVDLINISIGCTSDNQKLRNIIKRAWKKEILIITSAGNFTKNNILYPSKYPETVSVGAMDKNGEIMYPTFFSQKKLCIFQERR